MPHQQMSRLMGKPTICICETKGADQLRGNREADQRLCFRYWDSTIPPLLNSKISSFQPASVLVHVGLCRPCSETTLLVFPRGGSYKQLSIRKRESVKLKESTENAKQGPPSGKHVREMITPSTPFYISKLGYVWVYLFSYFCSKTQIVGTRQDRLGEAVLTCTHNLCFEHK